MNYHITFCQAEIEVLQDALQDYGDGPLIDNLLTRLNSVLTCESINYFGNCPNKREGLTKYCVEHQAEVEVKVA